MKFKVIASEQENLFFFISNLTNFHFSCREGYNTTWLEKTGPLSKQERDTLESFKKIAIKYGFNSSKDKNPYLGKIFYPAKETRKWVEMRKVLNKEEDKITSETFKIFKSRFQKIYEPELLNKWKQTLEKDLNGKVFQQALKEAKTFYSSTHNEKEMVVHLIGAPVRGRGPAGGANIGSGRITLEVPVYNLEPYFVEQALAIAAHEVCHLFLDSSPFYKLYERKKNHRIYNEFLVEIVSPWGYLAQKYSRAFDPFGDIILRLLTQGEEEYEKYLQEKNYSHNPLMVYFLWKMYPEIARYFSQGKPLDKHLFKKISALIEKNKYGKHRKLSRIK